MDYAVLPLILLGPGYPHADAVAPAPTPAVISELPEQQSQVADDGFTTQEICIVLGDTKFLTRIVPSESDDPMSPSNWAV
ncbi:hypothetical protein [Streptomyces profundus]|uniref:hypothetical protein n=1 Tax=Streptomyces profundus TaxID=2867410 RepID=UPI001D16335D|nr:hypothetical protein [Streptomyces sp. MA3_2.13]UED86149.1 hypothetical protein K4G22_19760 [Streptomyces sp. MA3_2.13]